MRNEYAEGKYWDADSVAWRRAKEIVGPLRARELIEEGTPTVVEWCDRAPRAESTATLEESVLPRVVSKSYSKRAVRGKEAWDTAFIAEEWRNEEGQSMLILVEGPPAPRDKSWFS